MMVSLKRNRPVYPVAFFLEFLNDHLQQCRRSDVQGFRLPAHIRSPPVPRDMGCEHLPRDLASVRAQYDERIRIEIRRDIQHGSDFGINQGGVVTPFPPISSIRFESMMVDEHLSDEFARRIFISEKDMHKAPHRMSMSAVHAIGIVRLSSRPGRLSTTAARAASNMAVGPMNRYAESDAMKNASEPSMVFDLLYGIFIFPCLPIMVDTLSPKASIIMHAAISLVSVRKVSSMRAPAA